MEIVDDAMIANREEMLEEARTRMKALPIEAGPKYDFIACERVLVSERASCGGEPVGMHRLLNPEERKAVYEAEEEYNCVVYYAMTAGTSYGRVLELFFVSEYADSWNHERCWLADGRPDAICVNLSGGFSEIGMVGYVPTEFGLIRTI